jgi:hypothetical protein
VPPFALRHAGGYALDGDHPLDVAAKLIVQALRDVVDGRAHALGVHARADGPAREQHLRLRARGPLDPRFSSWISTTRAAVNAPLTTCSNAATLSAAS